MLKVLGLVAKDAEKTFGKTAAMFGVGSIRWTDYKH